jgi:hypothetical protein
MRERIDRHDYHAVFAHGECFRFALRLHQRFQYKIRGVRVHLTGEKRTWSHVWAMKDDRRGVDINGVHEERVLAALCGHEGAHIEDVVPEEIRALNQARGYPAALENELDELADKIVDTHERLAGAKPVDPVAYAAFLEDLKKGANHSVQRTPGNGSSAAAESRARRL